LQKRQVDAPAVPEWPADRVERRPVATLIPYARNARTHSDEQIEQLAASIREWGWTVPVLVDDEGTIIAGHGRVMAVQKLNITEVPVMVATGWTEAQRRAYALADNQLALKSGWDAELLRAELADLQGGGFDMGLAGFEAADLSAMMAGPAAEDDQAEESAPRASLADRFMLPPFSVLNACEGWWQARKQAWLGLGLQSELGRGANLLQFSDTIIGI
jgi:ParB-like chromosome segregation protein Spo0J